MSAQNSNEPKAGRPLMPGYNLLDAESGTGLRPWSWAIKRLTQAHNYFLSTTRPDGRPHLMPIWGVWMNQKFFFSTGRQSRKARNLAINHHCVITTERGDESIIVEGIAEEVTEPNLLHPFYEVYQEKYQWDLATMNDPIFAIRPSVVFAVGEEDFTGSATRWIFDPSENETE